MSGGNDSGRGGALGARVLVARRPVDVSGGVSGVPVVRGAASLQRGVLPSLRRALSLAVGAWAAALGQVLERRRHLVLGVREGLGPLRDLLAKGLGAGQGRIP